MTTSIVNLLEDAARLKQPAFLWGDGLDISFQCQILNAESARTTLENPVRPEFIKKFSASSRFTLQVKMLRLETPRIIADGRDLIFPISSNSVIEETRQTERFMFSPEEKVVCEILNPFDRETRLVKTVMDMSAKGLSLKTNKPSKLFAPGNILPEIKVFIDGKPYANFAGTIVYNRKYVDLTGGLKVQVGIKSHIGD